MPVVFISISKRLFCGGKQTPGRSSLFCKQKLKPGQLICIQFSDGSGLAGGKNVYVGVFMPIQNDVFKVFFEASAGVSLGAFFFWYIPFKLVGLLSSLKNKFKRGGRKDA